MGWAIIIIYNPKLTLLNFYLNAVITATGFLTLNTIKVYLSLGTFCSVSVAWGVIPREDFSRRHNFLQGWLAAEFFVALFPCCTQGIVGNLASGKSALVHRYLTGTYVQEESPEDSNLLTVDRASPPLLLKDEYFSLSRVTIPVCCFLSKG
ncbi:hypothetical protein EK904_013984 [Melospiza melodia maxima]|nr:hypothetical protein EK904_013984 [Melospiza melodia maxima]